MRCLAWLLVATALMISTARADRDSDARGHYEQATAAFALGKYNEAANAYERAFELKPDRALLYNAAQSHRLAGNKQRALALYQNYIRLYGKGAANRGEVLQLIQNLKRAIENDREAATAPPTSTAPIGTRPAPDSENEPGLTPPSETETKPQPPPENVVAKTPPPKDKPVYKKPWFWGVVAGGAAVVILAVGLGVGLGTQSSSDPMPTFGTARGN